MQAIQSRSRTNDHETVPEQAARTPSAQPCIPVPINDTLTSHWRAGGLFVQDRIRCGLLLAVVVRDQAKSRSSKSNIASIQIAMPKHTR